MTSTAIIAVIGLVVSLVVTVVGALLGLVVRGSERRIADLERKVGAVERAAEAHRAADLADHTQLTARVHSAEVEIARLQSLHELRPELTRVQRTLDLLLQEVAGLKGSLRPWSRTPGPLLPSEPPKRGT